MALHRRRNSHGSKSILNHLRSTSRGASRVERSTKGSERSQSASRVPYDPANQPPAGSRPSISTRLRSTTNNTVTKSTALSRMPSVNSSETLSPLQKYEITVRPRSWRFLRIKPSHSRKQSDIYENATNVKPSLISAPILDSTSNAKVAEAEGVCQSAMHHLPFHQEELATPIQYSTELQSTGVQPGRFLNAFRSLRRRKAASEPLAVEDTRPQPIDHLRRISLVESGTLRRKAETTNLRRAKINKLTGHGHVRRKQITDSTPYPDSLAAESQRSRILNATIMTGTASKLQTGHVNKSSALSINELDLHEIASRSRTTSGSSAPYAEERSKDAEINSRSSNRFSSSISSEHSTCCKIEDQDTVCTKLLTKLTGIHPSPFTFDGRENAYVTAKFPANRPRGVDPLGMHTNTMHFGTAPSHITDLPVPQIANKLRPIIEHDDLPGDAHMYSPSSGNLRQDSRPSCSVLSATAGRELDETGFVRGPSRCATDYMKRPGLRKSKSGLSGLTLLSRAKAGRSTVSKERQLANKTMRKARSIHFGLFTRHKMEHTAYWSALQLSDTSSSLASTTNASRSIEREKRDA